MSQIIEIFIICLSKFFVSERINKLNCQPTDWEKNFTNPKSDRGLISNRYRELKKLDYRKPNNPIKNGVQS